MNSKNKILKGTTLAEAVHKFKSCTMDTIKEGVQNHLKYRLAKEMVTSTIYDNYLSLAYTIRDRLVDNWLKSQKKYRSEKVRRVYYLSLEFLMGRTLGNSIINLGLENAVTQALDDLGMTLEDLREAELDAGLGNGGLGRLAACFMDSLATLEIPAYGYGIRYEYGIFHQKIIQGNQIEEPDEWLSRENPWEIARPEYNFRVKFGGRVVSRINHAGRLIFDWMDTEDVLATAFDTPIPGYQNKTVNNLRLWAAKATQEFDLDFFNQGNYFAATSKKTESETISKVLYPNDNSPEGRVLRLKQQYFFVSASIQDIIRRFYREHDNLKELPNYAVIQLNDTHPTIAIVELLRILIDDEFFEWDDAWNIVKKVFAYTNHTLLPEALEKWPVNLFNQLFPRHLQLIQEINSRFIKEISKRFPADIERIKRVSIFEESIEQQIRMAHLAIIGSFSINGVSELHTELLKKTVVPDFYDIYPEKFNNKTNGITQRRWLKKCNPSLSQLISSHIGNEWIKDLYKLKKLEGLIDNKEFIKEWIEVKQKNKEKLAQLIFNEQSLTISVNSMFDVQVKRIHEYKRQLLNILHAISLYQKIKENPSESFVPRTILFGGKAAPGYLKAKLIIRFICSVAEVINSDSDAKNKLSIAFLPNYRVSLAEKIIPATDLSEQISTAGKEASGTGNMKFALNGALTIGTLDGANIEIQREVGEKNIFIFGLTADEISKMKKIGYNPRSYYEKSSKLKKVLNWISSGFFSPDNPDLFKPISHWLLETDEYMLLADFDSYLKCQEQVSAIYTDQVKWTQMAIRNVANMGKFSSDRAISEYCKDIWNIKPVSIESSK
jgi:starch phosphorylase